MPKRFERFISTDRANGFLETVQLYKLYGEKNDYMLSLLCVNTMNDNNDNKRKLPTLRLKS